MQGGQYLLSKAYHNLLPVLHTVHSKPTASLVPGVMYNGMWTLKKCVHFQTSKPNLQCHVAGAMGVLF